MNDFQKESVPLLGSTEASIDARNVLPKNNKHIKSEVEIFSTEFKSDEYCYGGLSSTQLKAVRSQLPTVVRAAAGTGKTNTIIHRIVKANTYDSMSLDNIFMCLPTPETAQKMVTNLHQLINDVPAYTDTIHGNAIRLLEAYPVLVTVHGYTKDFELIDDIKFDTLLAETLKSHVKYLYTKFAISIPKAKKYLRAGIKFLKNKGFYTIDLHESPAQVSQDNILLLTDAFQEIPADIAFETYEALQKKMKQQNLLDTFDVIALATFAMRDMDIRYTVNGQFKLVIMDSFQDFSELQFEMVEYLAHDGKYLYLTGDEGQLVDDWDAHTLSKTIEHYSNAPETHKVFLETNYRSQAYIASLSAQIGRRDAMHQIHTIQPATHRILSLTISNTEEEAQYVKETIQTLISSGAQANEIAVIARNNEYLQTLEDVLRSHKIAYYFNKNTTYTLDTTDEDKGNIVQLMTIHGSKGLEFEHVFIIGAVNGLMPMLRDMPHTITNNLTWSKILLEAELRLFYVATSRAKQTLTILSPIYVPKIRSKHTKTMFLKNLDEYIKTKHFSSKENKHQKDNR